ncbi:hypothetical protein D9758_013204 [Tetrapyrgos nigripes]|uniref:Retrotransposon gag domain-containing protein n=1 Tax=Tetrapyrgos nigripes TaxID=182062 RepID=A0A8H5CT86_9AGAR|nr:hypothetical protein D9758_013204 [Tetrapyrgos nigripes]
MSPGQSQTANAPLSHPDNELTTNTTPNTPARPPDTISKRPAAAPLSSASKKPHLSSDFLAGLVREVSGMNTTFRALLVPPATPSPTPSGPPPPTCCDSIILGNSATTSTTPSRAPSCASCTSHASSSVPSRLSCRGQLHGFDLIDQRHVCFDIDSYFEDGDERFFNSAFLLQHFHYLPLPSPTSHIPIIPSSPIPSDINMSEQAQQPHFDMHCAEQIHQAATIQDIINAHGLLQEQVTTFLQRINQQQTQPQPQAHTISQSSDKYSMAKPEPFKGKAVDVRSFLASFRNWAGEQRDIAGNEGKMIRSALSFMQGEAGIWAVPYIEEAMAYNRTNQTVNLFNGTWSIFVEAFKAQFGSLDEQADARDAIEGLVQGKQTVVKYIQVFRDLGQSTDYSDEDL